MPKSDAYLDEMAKKGGTQKKIDQRGTKAFPTIAAGRAGSGVITNNVANAILANDTYDIKVAIGYWNSFNFSCTPAQTHSIDPQEYDLCLYHRESPSFSDEKR